MARSFVRRVAGTRWLHAAILSPVIARPGYWFATLMAFLWGSILSGFHVHRKGGLWLAAGLPHWAFGRGGTTVGAVYLTSDNYAPPVLEHEAVHREQWKRYGLAFIPLYVEAGQEARTNRFEVEAGLSKGGYGV